MSFHWYALHCKPRKEQLVWEQLLARQFETLYPRTQVQPVNPRARKVRPYFPGYVFVNADLQKVGFSALQWLPHARGLVSFGGEPATVPETLISAIRRRVDEANACGGDEAAFGLQPGDRVRLQSGPFEGYQAIFDTRLQGAERVRVLLTLLENQRQIPLDVDVTQLKRV